MQFGAYELTSFLYESQFFLPFEIFPFRITMDGGTLALEAALRAAAKTSLARFF